MTAHYFDRVKAFKPANATAHRGVAGEASISADRRTRRQKTDFIELALAWQELAPDEQAEFGDDLLVFERWADTEARRLLDSVDD